MFYTYNNDQFFFFLTGSLFVIWRNEGCTFSQSKVLAQIVVLLFFKFCCEVSQR